MLSPDIKRPNKILWQAVLGLSAASMTVAIVFFAYFGIYSRLLADDYCETIQATQQTIFSALIYRYETTSDRYSNFLFDALSSLLGPHNVQFIPAIMIIGWTIALTWLLYLVKQLGGWQWPWLIDFYLAASLVFFSILQAPNRYQTFYWRSAMATHFAPLVYLTIFSAVLMTQVRHAATRPPASWVGPLFLIAAFLGGGFSEPPDAMLIVASGLAIAAVAIWEKGTRRRTALLLLIWTLAGGLLALLVMKLSPNVLRLRTPPPDLLTLIYRTSLNTAQFIQDSLLTLPVPTMVSMAISFLVFYTLFSSRPSLLPTQRRVLSIVMIAIPLLMYILIAASFAPSIYGQSYPVARARFAGRLTMILALMSEGAFFGLLFANWKHPWQNVATTVSLVLLAISVIYPLRAIWIIDRTEVPFFKQWSSLWDLRESQILEQKSKGVEDIQLFPLISIAGVKEFDASPDYWVNRCAAAYYGVNSISAPGPE